MCRMSFPSLIVPGLFGLCSAQGHQHGLFAFVPAGSPQLCQPFHRGCSAQRGCLWLTPTASLPLGEPELGHFTGAGGAELPLPLMGCCGIKEMGKGFSVGLCLL